MALIVEDGTIVAGANSYVSRSDYIEFASRRGVAVDDNESADVPLLQAAQFIDSHGDRLKGTQVSRSQPMAYPRTDLIIEGFEWDDDEIPTAVTLCQMALALEIRDGVDLYNRPSAPLPVRRTKVEGAVEEEYAVQDVAKMSKRSVGTALLNTLLQRSGLMLKRA